MKKVFTYRRGRVFLFGRPLDYYYWQIELRYREIDSGIIQSDWGFYSLCAGLIPLIVRLLGHLFSERNPDSIEFYISPIDCMVFSIVLNIATLSEIRKKYKTEIGPERWCYALILCCCLFLTGMLIHQFNQHGALFDPNLLTDVKGGSAVITANWSESKKVAAIIMSLFLAFMSIRFGYKYVR